MLCFKTILKILLFGLFVCTCQGQSPTPTAATPRYSTLIQNLAAASRARSVLETKLNIYKRAYETIKQNDLHDKTSLGCCTMREEAAGDGPILFGFGLSKDQISYECFHQKNVILGGTCSCVNEPSVAFTAFLNKNVPTFGVQQPLPFDNVTFNSGNGYDTRNSAFTAPVDGIYQVFVTIATNAGYHMVMDILHDNTLLAKLRTGNENQWHTATNSVIVRMKKGEDIWVQHDRTTTDSNRLYYGIGMITSFSGYLIHKD